MKISLGADREKKIPTTKKPSVVIAQNLKRERVVLDADGNEIDLRSGRIINKAEQN